MSELDLEVAMPGFPEVLKAGVLLNRLDGNTVTYEVAVTTRDVVTYKRTEEMRRCTRDSVMSKVLEVHRVVDRLTNIEDYEVVVIFGFYTNDENF